MQGDEKGDTEEVEHEEDADKDLEKIFVLLIRRPSVKAMFSDVWCYWTFDFGSR